RGEIGDAVTWRTFALLLAPTPVILMAVDEIWLHVCFRSIPVRSAFTTFNDGTTPADPAMRTGLNRVWRKFDQNPDIFLVRGKNLAGAMDASARRVEKN